MTQPDNPDDPGRALWAEAFTQAVDDIQTACLADGMTLSPTERLMMEAGAAAGVSSAMLRMAEHITTQAP